MFSSTAAEDDIIANVNRGRSNSDISPKRRTSRSSHALFDKVRDSLDLTQASRSRATSEYKGIELTTLLEVLDEMQTGQILGEGSGRGVEAERKEEE